MLAYGSKRLIGKGENDRGVYIYRVPLEKCVYQHERMTEVYTFTEYRWKNVFISMRE